MNEESVYPEEHVDLIEKVLFLCKRQLMLFIFLMLTFNLKNESVTGLHVRLSDVQDTYLI